MRTNDFLRFFPSLVNMSTVFERHNKKKTCGFPDQKTDKLKVMCTIFLIFSCCVEIIMSVIFRSDCNKYRKIHPSFAVGLCTFLESLKHASRMRMVFFNTIQCRFRVDDTGILESINKPHGHNE
jgi:hypothetical protein